MKTKIKIVSVLATALAMDSAGAFTFETESVKGSFDSTVTVGLAQRLLKQDCGLVGDPKSRCGTSANVEQWSNGDNGNLNYNKGDLFAAYLKGSHELLLKLPEEVSIMARGAWLYDFKAPSTRRTELESDAKNQVARDVSLLDLWVSKGFNIGDQHARVRVGNQVVSWGESIFWPGGINSTNALDLQKLYVPGAQLKEAVLPAPMLSFASGLGHGFNMDAYYQFRWNKNRYPPVGSYFSASDIYGKGSEPLYGSTTNYNFGGVDAGSIAGSRNLTAIHQAQAGLLNGDFAGPPNNSIGYPFDADKTPKNKGQFGVALHYKPDGMPVDFGAYYLNYHDKNPVLGYDSNFKYQWKFLEDRKLFGVSANFPVGDWAVGMELSYRPKDAVALTGCYNAGGQLDFQVNAAVVDCQQWIDQKKYQLHLTGQLQLTPSDYGTILKGLGNADTAYLTAEAVFIRYPGVSPDQRYVRTVNGVSVVQAPSAAYGYWNDNSTIGSLGYPIGAAVGTANSWGYAIDFNWTYDSKLIQGWLVTPGVTFYHAVKGDTPAYYATFLQDVKSMNVYVNFVQNPATWQAGVNYTTYFGADKLRQGFGDRDFIGGYVSRNF